MTDWTGKRVRVLDAQQDTAAPNGFEATIVEDLGAHVTFNDRDGDERYWEKYRLELIDAETPFSEAEQAMACEYPDNVEHPPHYTAGEIECIDAIRAALTPEEFRGFCKGNVIKYAWRERLKGGNESLKKAVWYANQAVSS